MAVDGPNVQQAGPPLKEESKGTAGFKPDYRNFIHVGAFVLTGPFLGILADPRHAIPNGRWIVVGFLVGVTLWNLLILPLQASGKEIRRPGEGFVNGTWMYPLALALGFTVFPAYAALAGWAAMAAGDAAASFVGRRFKKPQLPWNPQKTWAGMLAFVPAALLFCMFALWWVPCPLFLKEAGGAEWPYVWTLAVLAACSGALLESLSGPADDNLRVPLGVGVVVWLAALFLNLATRGMPAQTHVQPEVLIMALTVNAVLAGAVLALKLADLPATIVGFVFGVLIYFFAQWQGFVLFLTFVAVGTLSSKLFLSYKQKIGTAEAREGQRGIGNVVANLLVPVFCCLAYPASGGHPAFLLAFAGALSAALADTLSSEIGTLSRSQPFLITTFKRVPHGTNGAVSVLGSAAALLAAGGLAGLAVATGFFPLIFNAGRPVDAAIVGWGAASIVVAGLVGTLVDSALGATVEDRWIGMRKGSVNFFCTLAGAGVAALGGIWIWSW